MILNIWCDTNTCDSEMEYHVVCNGLVLIYSDNRRAYSHNTATVSVWHKDEFFDPIASIEVSRNYTVTEAAKILIDELVNDFENINSDEFTQLVFMVECFKAWYTMEYPAEWC